MKINKIISILLLLVMQPCLGMKRVDVAFIEPITTLINSEKMYGKVDFSRLSDDELKKTIIELQKVVMSDIELSHFSRETKINKQKLKELVIDIIVRAQDTYKKRTSVAKIGGLGPEVSFLQAAMNGDLPAVKWYLERNVDVNSATPGKETALVLAVSRGYGSIVKELMAAGANINLANSFGYTPLHFAIKNKFFNIAHDLVDAGADVNVKDNAGMTPLMLGAMSGYPNIINALLLAGARLEEKDKNGKTALFYAQASGNKRIVEILLDAQGWAKK